MEHLKARIGDKVVSVAVLRIEGKKLTQALFRQIPCVDYLTDTLEVDSNIVPWGRVSCKIPQEGAEWLVGAQNGQLIRCSIDLPSLSESMVTYHEKGISEYAEKLKRELERGSAPTTMATLYQDSLTRHQTHLPEARAQLEADKVRHAAYLELKQLPQLFLGA